ncbi:hypothetical protein ES319_A13G010700v1 [Gossypium barbadense]|uniref:GIR1-like zinc ribbon domain-containing protein n=1 Tax=Gossypium barbadense TaxID=3634 RepID=A0A5J5SWD3_GOSBA|nr:hypothetical protein ES319_A13G010700v1 [Gossypium barbadense]
MASKIPKIKQESPMDDVRFSNTSLISNATVSMKNCSNINQSVKHDEEISSASLSEMSRMLLNQQDFSGEEIEFNFPMAEEPSLVVMACTRCLMYVMACEVNPKCANCKTSDHLLDIFRDPPQNP